MTYNEIVKNLELTGVLPLLSVNNAKDALVMMGVLESAGINMAEITFRTTATVEAIRVVASKCKNIIVGAGTVISEEQVVLACEAGAKFIVTPSFNPKVVDKCLELGIPVFPGCSTPTDIEQAFGKGLKVVKFFPAELAGGVDMINVLSGPYPFMKFMPTGGINSDNLNKYLACDKVICCGGTYLVDPDLLKHNKIDEISRNVHNAVRSMLDIKLDHVAINSDMKEGTEILKTFSNLMGYAYNDEDDKIGGIEVARENHNGTRGHIAFSSPSLERCMHYLEKRGFLVDKSTIVKENSNIVKLHLIGEHAGFTIQLIKKGYTK